jgi:TRAP-type C4-dicarboxylate transport system substrate-binding protein
MPLSSVAELPGGFDKSCTGTHAYWKLATGEGIIAKREMQPNGVHLVFTALGPPYQILSTKKIDGVASLAGQKLRSYGGHQDTALKELGAVPVRMAAPEMYEAVTRGTLDGVVIPYASVFSYKLQDVVKYATDGLNFGSVAFNYVMNEQKWKSLSPKLRAAFEKVGPTAIEYACQFLDKDATTAYDKLKAGGVVMARFSDADTTSVHEKLAVIPKLWSTALDKRGKPGTEVLKAFEAALGK